MVQQKDHDPEPKVRVSESGNRLSEKIKEAAAVEGNTIRRMPFPTAFPA